MIWRSEFNSKRIWSFKTWILPHFWKYNLTTFKNCSIQSVAYYMGIQDEVISIGDGQSNKRRVPITLDNDEVIDEVAVDAPSNNFPTTESPLPRMNWISLAVSENPLIVEARDDSVVLFEKLQQIWMVFLEYHINFYQVWIEDYLEHLLVENMNYLFYLH